MDSTLDVLEFDDFCGRMVCDRRDMSFSKVRNGLNDFSRMRDVVAKIDAEYLHDLTTTQVCTYLLERYAKVTGEKLPEDAVSRMQNCTDDFTDKLVKRMDDEMFPNMDMSKMSYEDIAGLYRDNELSIPKPIEAKHLEEASHAPNTGFGLFGIDVTKDASPTVTESSLQKENESEKVKTDVSKTSDKPKTVHRSSLSFDTFDMDFGMGE